MHETTLRDYESPLTQHTCVAMEDGVMLTGSKDPVANPNKADETVITIDRQEGANGSVDNGGNIGAGNDFNVSWDD
ncbi:MAG: hypothetical protein HUJ98_07975 [Bacteroidaceae bacterium]|nr:hypothetical protein [Bacteroidaceae bacterium]